MNLLNYPQKSKYPTFFLKKRKNIFVIGFLFLFTVICTSCKTCDCPAYSKIGLSVSKNLSFNQNYTHSNLIE